MVRASTTWESCRSVVQPPTVYSVSPMANALRPYAESRGGHAPAALAAAGIDPRRRPETLQLQELARLAEYFASG